MMPALFSNPGVERAKPHILLDLSRLLWRAERFAPTGIDRVELAYARHLIATACNRLSFVARWGRLGLLPDKHVVAFIAALDALWSGACVNREARARTAALARRLRRHVLIRGERPLHAFARAKGGRLVYLLVSHHGLVRPSALIRFKQRADARVVCLVHDLIPIHHPEYVRRGDASRHQRRMDTVARFADRVIVNSAGTKAALDRHFQQAGRTAPIRVAPLGIDLWPSKHRSITAADPPYFIYIATIEPRKNHLLLLRVWRHLAAVLGSHAPRLVLVGRRGLKSRRTIGLIERFGLPPGLVEQHNQLPDAAVVNVVESACALLYPSFAEGYGLPVAEGLALGIPVLCSDLPELHEIGHEVPEYLDPFDEPAWRRAILDYAQTGSLRRQQQLTRLAQWRPPRWEQHFDRVLPLIDYLPA